MTCAGSSLYSHHPQKLAKFFKQKYPASHFFNQTSQAAGSENCHHYNLQMG